MSQQLLYYTIAISSLTGAAPSDGFIDNNTAASYIEPGTGDTYDDEIDWPDTLADSLAKTRGNLRWTAILQQLSSAVNPFAINDIVATDATGSIAATGFGFTVVYDRPDYLYAYDELNEGAILYNDLAVKRWVARALIENIVTTTSVLDPTSYTSPAYHYGPSYQNVVAGPLAVDIPTAEAAITVTFVAAVSGIPAYPL